MLLELATLCDDLMMMVFLRMKTLFRVGKDVRSLSWIDVRPSCNWHTDVRRAPVLTNLGGEHMRWRQLNTTFGFMRQVGAPLDVMSRVW